MNKVIFMKLKKEKKPTDKQTVVPHLIFYS